MHRLRFYVPMIFLIAAVTVAYGQRQPDPNVGNQENTRLGTMDGNLVRTVFFNHGEIANWDDPSVPSGEWPKGSGHTYVDGVALVVAAPIVDINGERHHSVVTRYREDMSVSPDGVPWGFAPLPGYFNPDPAVNVNNSPAMSNDPRTWPASWPDKPSDWAGYWNGFFGKGVTNADLETYLVFDDDPDEKYLYFPDPSDSSRRGLGLEVASRLFQWNQVLAQDVIFTIYYITNEGKKDYDSTYFAFHIDWGIGGHDDSADDAGNYDLDLDIAWAYDGNGYGSPGNWSPVGVAGFAFLESPGIFRDSRDNDDDGLVDEKRDSGAGIFLTTYPYGVDNVNAYRKFFPERQLHSHWSGDEDIDWDAYTDLNGNGQWDLGEPLNDDVGMDGLRPEDFNYPGADEGEGDNMPTEGEPDFDFTDKDESDQIGLTGFNAFVLHEYKMEYDEAYWRGLKSAPPPRDKLIENTNLGMFFSSGPFRLLSGDTQFYSMALLFGEDQYQLSRTKKTVQQIYNADYRFAKPPERPRLTAVPGDHKVVLYWDDRAEQSWDPFLQIYDFEGYRIYRTTEPNFIEDQIITDSFGKKRFRQPIAQFDLENGIKGLHPVDVEGIKYYLGNDTGLRHYFVDTDVQNGQNYFYAVVSYDQGLVDTSITGEIAGISPSECASVIKVNPSGVVEFVDVNTAVVTPQAPAAGYVSPHLTGPMEHQGPGTGEISIELLDPHQVKDNNIYEIVFFDTSAFGLNPNPNYELRNATTSEVLLTAEPLIHSESLTPVLEGFVLHVRNDSAAKIVSTEWAEGIHDYIFRVGMNSSLSGRFVSYPADFEMRFFAEKVDTSQSLLFGQKAIPVNFKIFNLTEDQQMDFVFGDKDKDDQFTSGDSVTIVIGNRLGEPLPTPKSRFKAAWAIFFDNLSGGNITLPQPGDRFQFRTSKPFRHDERFQFTLTGANTDPEKARRSLSEITVVPNPYCAAANWEPSNPFQFGRGERRIFFNHLPQKCTIRIYTVRGFLVDTIEHDSPVENGSEAWNLVSKDGMDIAYGLYIFQVEAPGIGEQIGKFAVIK